MSPALSCKDELRRQEIHKRGYNGIDFIEVMCPDQTSLCVHLISKGLEKIDKENVRIEGGTRIRDIRAKEVRVIPNDDPELEDCLRIKLNKAGDFSLYTLKLVEAENGKVTDRVLTGFDPRYAEAEFSFKVCCDSDLDCQTPMVCPPEKRVEPEIDYLAKDYAGFRQLILDRLALIMPDWKERHVPDLGITLVEILAYTGDHLSYYQDAVATEAYLDTARQRISVRRHARLVDYAMHEGCNARAFVCLNLKNSNDSPDSHNAEDTSSSITLKPEEIFFIISCNKLNFAEGKVLKQDELIHIPETDYEVFEPLTGKTDPIKIFAAHNEITFYTWGDRECCLRKGSTRATLKDSVIVENSQEQENLAKPALVKIIGQVTQEPDPNTPRALDNLKKGDILIFEEVLGPKTGNPADADPRHRQAVYLTWVGKRDIDPLTKQPVRNIEWAAEDALAFPLCISTKLPAPKCKLIGPVSIARGNVILVDHGRTIGSEDLGTVGTESFGGICNCQGMTDVIYLPAKFSPVLQEKPVTFRQPLVPDIPASAMLDQDPRKALPQIILTGQSVLSGTPVSQDDLKRKLQRDFLDHQRNNTVTLTKVSALSTPLSEQEDLHWISQPDLLDSREDDQDFVVEINNEGCACLRFGDGKQGKVPEAGLSFTAQYRIGNGPSGNVGAETIKYLVLRKTPLSGIEIRPRNPMPATGGTLAEPLDEVRLSAPHAYRKKLERAITAGDYAEIAGRNKKIQKASAALRWTGSWYEAQVAVDPFGTEETQQSLKQEIEGDLHQYRRVGHDVAVVTAEYVPLDLTLNVCVEPEFLRAHVEAALLDRFSNRILPDGKYGFFHPDKLTFGSGISVTSIIAAAQEIPGVRCVAATLKRLDADDASGIEDRILDLGPMEIALLDNDPSFPEHGKLTLTMEGGR